MAARVAAPGAAAGAAGRAARVIAPRSRSRRRPPRSCSVRRLRGRRRRGARRRPPPRRPPATPTATPRRAPAASARRPPAQDRRLRQRPCSSPPRPGPQRRSSWSSRAGGSGSSATGASSRTPFLDIRAGHLGRRAGAAGRWPSRPTTRLSGLFYVYYTDRAGDTRVVEYRRASADRADPARRGCVLGMPDAESNHNGGLLLFGPDGRLYIGLGDGGGAATSTAPRQRAEPRRACSARSCASTRAARAAGRTASRAATRSRAQRRARRDLQLRPAQPVALLVRPPQRRPLDRRRRAERGRGDRLRARAAAAARTSAGARSRATAATRPASPRPGHVRPVIERLHSRGNCSITGGVVVRDRALRGLHGRYVFGDFCRGRIESAG